MRRALLAGVVLLIVVAALAYGALQRWLASDAFRRTLERQAAAALDMPVRIDGARATFFPRLGIALSDVSVGEPPSAQLDQVSIAAGFSVLWSRRVESADVRLTGGYLEPSWLAALAASAASVSRAPAGDVDESAPLTVVSIRSIGLRDVTLTTGDEKVPIDLDASLDGDRLAVTDLTARVRDATVHVEGEMSSLARREGRFTVRADVLPATELLALLGSLQSDDSGGSASSPRTPPAPFHVTADIAAPVAILGSWRTEAFAAALEAAPSETVLDPITFGLNGGRVEMRAAIDPSDADALVDTRGRVSGVDVAQLQAADGAGPERLSGRLDATFAMRLPATGDFAALRSGAHGTIDLAIRDGRMPGIAIVREAVLRLADRANPPPPVEGTDAYSQLAASLTLQPGAARITRLALNAADFDLEGHGVLSPVDWRLAIDATVTLTEELSAQAGRDLYRYAHDGRRIVLPVSLGGTLFEPSATIDLARAADRAIRNRVEEEVQSLFERLIRTRPAN